MGSEGVSKISGQKNLGCKLFASLCVGNALTTILLRYTYYYDYEISFCHFCNRTCHRLRCASSITQPGRVARRIAFTR